MTRGRIGLALGALALILLGVYIARNSYWTTETVRTPATGAALRNPFYAVQRFTRELGAQASRLYGLGELPPENAVIVLTAWHWQLIDARRAALKKWVHDGGRLVADRSLLGAERDLKHWAHITRSYPERPQKRSLDDEVIPAADARCGYVDVQGRRPANPPPQPSQSRYEVCDFENYSRLETSAPPDWSLSDQSGLQAARVRIGRGSFTLINAEPFRNTTFFDGDHAAIFVAATQLTTGDHIYFLSDEESESLLSLIWRYGAPVVLLAAALVALALWRGSARFGPPLAAPETARRSLGEQIRGTGWFTVRYGGGAALRAAAVRALFEAARARIVSFDRLPAEQRVAALARAARLDPQSLAAAVNFSGPHRPGELHHTLALLETARRAILRSKEH